MFFLNLSLPEFLMLFSAASGLVVTLYLLNRSRRKLTVATLRFWKNAERPAISSHRRRIQQPLSLILQLLSIALLLLAIAQLRIGAPDRTSRDHVLILDTSAWMGAHGRRGTLLDEAKASAKAFVRALPSTDRVMLVRADGLATPATSLETDKKTVIAAIDQSRPGAAALNLEQALAFAAQVQKRNARRLGEVVFAGAGRVNEGDGALQAGFSAPLRILPVTQNVENCGLKKVGLRRSASDPGLWEVFISARNYGTRPRSVPLVLLFGGAQVGSRRLQLIPGKDEEATLQFRTRAAGWLEARLLTDDALAEDNRAILELPPQKPLKVAVYTEQPDLLRPIFNANPLVEASYLRPAEFNGKTDAQIVIFDRFRPKEAPKVGTIWIEAPAERSPVTVRTTVHEAPIVRWRADHPLTTGLRTKRLKLDSSQVYAPGKGDIAIAEVEAGPVVIARSTTPRMVAIGFNPRSPNLRFDLATPLLFANILSWMEPEIFRHRELIAGTVGTVTVPLEGEGDAGSVRVISDRQQQLPFAVHGSNLRFFAGSPGTVRVITANNDQVYSLTLPEVGDKIWEPPASARHGIPGRIQEALSRDIWQVLAILGALGLLVEWMLFARVRAPFARLQPRPVKDALRKAS